MRVSAPVLGQVSQFDRYSLAVVRPAVGPAGLFEFSVFAVLQQASGLAARQVAAAGSAVSPWPGFRFEARFVPLPETKETLVVAAPVVAHPMSTVTGDCSAPLDAERIEKVGVHVGYSQLQLRIDPFSRLLPKPTAEMQMVRAVGRLRHRVGDSSGLRDLKGQEQVKPRVTYSAANVDQFADHSHHPEVVAFCLGVVVSASGGLEEYHHHKGLTA